MTNHTEGVGTEFRTHISAAALRETEEAGLMNGAQTHMIPLSWGGTAGPR